MPHGTVKWFSTQKGYGFITQDGGGDVFVHITGLAPGTTSLDENQRVEFELSEGRKGPQATNVKPPAAEEATQDQPPAAEEATEPPVVEEATQDQPPAAEEATEPPAVEEATQDQPPAAEEATQDQPPAAEEEE